MEEGLRAAQENYSTAKYRATELAQQDSAVREYLSDMQGATSQEDAQAARNGLVSSLFVRSEKGWIANHPDADLDAALRQFAEALKSYMRGEAALSIALERAGFDEQPYEMNTALSYAGQQLLMAESRGMDGAAQYRIKPLKRVDAQTIEDNKRTVSAMEPVKRLRGDEFTVGGSELRQQVAQYFEEIGGSAYNEALGDVELTKRGVKDSLSHGIGPEKAAAFAAVKEVIEQGKIIDFQENWKNRGYSTFVIAAPIEINAEDYFQGVIVMRKDDTQRYYLHEVVTIKKSEIESRSTGVPDNRYLPGGINPTINNILATINNVNTEKIELSENANEKFSLKKDDIARSVEEDAELYAQVKSDPAIAQAVGLEQKLWYTVRRGDGYLREGLNAPVLEAGAWKGREGEIADKLIQETGSRCSRNELIQKIRTLFTQTCRKAPAFRHGDIRHTLFPRQLGYRLAVYSE